MRISTVQNRIGFQRALTPEELNQQAPVRSKALELLGQTGQSVFIINDSCLPQSPAKNTGAGNLASDDAIEFLKYMKDYLGFNTVEILPQGNLRRNHNTYINYGGSSYSLGIQVINPELLTTDEFENLLTKDDVDRIIKANKMWENCDSHVNFENIVTDNSSQDKVIRKAFEKFKRLDTSSPLKKKYEIYNAENNDWLEPKAVFEILKRKNDNKWFRTWEDFTEKNLYDDVIDEAKRRSYIQNLINNNYDEAEYTKFKCFLADEHLQTARNKLHENGLELKGDCLIGWGDDEIWSHPKAFRFGDEVGWGIDAINYRTIRNKNSDALNVLKRKVELCARRYDSIRFDVGWAYIAPKISGQSLDLGDDFLLKMIEDTVLKVKGKDYDLKKLVWEFEAGPNDFSLYKDGKPREEFKNRVSVFSQAHISNDWGYLENFTERGWSKDDLLLGAANHDPIPLRQLAEGKDPEGFRKPNEIRFQKEAQIPVLSRILKLDEKTLRENPVEFAKAKFALPLTSKNYMTFYMDVFGRADRFDKQEFHTWEDYRNKVPADYKSAYHKSLQEGFGFNIMDGIAKQMKARGLHEQYPGIYKEVIKFRNILLEPEKAVNTVIDTFETSIEKTKDSIENIVEISGESIQKSSGNKWIKWAVLGTGTAALGSGVYYYLTNRNRDLQNGTKV